MDLGKLSLDSLLDMYGEISDYQELKKEKVELQKEISLLKERIQNIQDEREKVLTFFRRDYIKILLIPGVTDLLKEVNFQPGE